MSEEPTQEEREAMFAEEQPTGAKAPVVEFHSIQSMAAEELKKLPRADAYITHQKRFSRQSDVRSDVYYADIAFDSRTIYHLPLSVVQYGLIATATGKDYVPDQFHEKVPVRVVKTHYKDRSFLVIDIYLCEDVRVSNIAEKDFATLFEKRLVSGQIAPEFKPMERTALQKEAFFPVDDAEPKAEGEGDQAE